MRAGACRPPHAMRPPCGMLRPRLAATNPLSTLAATAPPQYSPLLLGHLPGARAVAAAALHEIYGAKMLPWLIGGALRCAAFHIPQFTRVCLLLR